MSTDRNHVADFDKLIFHVLIQNEGFGPFSYYEIWNLIKEKKISSFDYIRQSHESSWQPLCDLEMFSKSQYEILSTQKYSKKSILSERRRFERKSLKTMVHLTHQDKMSLLSAVEIGQGGMAVFTEDVGFIPNEPIKLQLKLGSKMFRARGKVISYVKNSHVLNIQFLGFAGQSEEILIQYLKKLSIQKAA